jgi:hypothetical protein
MVRRCAAKMLFLYANATWPNPAGDKCMLHASTANPLIYSAAGETACGSVSLQCKLFRRLE